MYPDSNPNDEGMGWVAQLALAIFIGVVAVSIAFCLAHGEGHLAIDYHIVYH